MPGPRVRGFDQDLHVLGRPKSRSVLGFPYGPVALVEGDPPAVAMVTRHLPFGPAPSGRDPDVVVSMHGGLSLAPGTRRLGAAFAFDGDGFFVVPRRRQGTLVRLRLDESGRPWSIDGADADTVVPLATAMVNVLAVRHGLLPLHCVAFERDGRTVAVTGWSGSGKTAALLDALAGGARLVASEWLFLTADAVVLASPHPIRVKPRHLSAAWATSILTRRQVLRLRLGRDVAGAVRRAPGGATAADALLHRASVDADAPPTAAPVPPLAELHVVEGPGDDCRARSVTAADVATPRLAAAFAEDLAPLAAVVRGMRFVGQSDVSLAEVEQQYRTMLRQVLADVTISVPTT